MASRMPASLRFTLGLLAVGFVAAATSLGVQRWQTQGAAQKTAHELTGGDESDRKQAQGEPQAGGHSRRHVLAPGLRPLASSAWRPRSSAPRPHGPRRREST